MASGEWAKLNSTTRDAGNIFHSSVIPVPTQARQDGRFLTVASSPAETWDSDAAIATAPTGTQSPALPGPSTTAITGRGLYPGASYQHSVFSYCKPGVRVDVAAGKIEMIWGFPGGHNDAATAGLIYADVIAGAAAKNASGTDGLVFEERVKPCGYLNKVHGDTVPAESPQYLGDGEWIATRNADNILVPPHMHTYAQQIWMPSLNRFHLSAPFAFSGNATSRPGAVWGYDPDTNTVDIYHNAGDITTRTGFSFITGTGGGGDGSLFYDEDNDAIYTTSTGNLYRWSSLTGTPSRVQVNSDTNFMSFEFLTGLVIITSPIDGSKMLFNHRSFGATFNYYAIGGITGTPTRAGDAIFGVYSGATFDLTPASQDWKSGVCTHPTKQSAVLIWQGTNNIFEVDLAAQTTAGNYTAPSAVFDGNGTGDSPGATPGTNHSITYLPAPWNALLCCALHGSGLTSDMGVWIYKL
jgi:hypothetical protein